MIAFESSSTRSSHSGQISQMESSSSEAFDAVSFDLATTVLVCFTGASDVLTLRDGAVDILLNTELVINQYYMFNSPVRHIIN